MRDTIAYSAIAGAVAVVGSFCALLTGKPWLAVGLTLIAYGVAVGCHLLDLRRLAETSEYATWTTSILLTDVLSGSCLCGHPITEHVAFAPAECVKCDCPGYRNR